MSSDLVPKQPWEFEGQISDIYDFFLDLGPLAKVDERWFHGQIGFWTELLAHPNRDAWWQARDPEHPDFAQRTGVSGSVEPYRCAAQGGLHAVTIGATN